MTDLKKTQPSNEASIKVVGFINLDEVQKSKTDSFDKKFNEEQNYKIPPYDDGVEEDHIDWMRRKNQK